MNATVPLEETLPFSSTVPRSILVCDSMETDASFLLHCFSNQALKQGHSVWWLTAKPVTDRQVAIALKKMGSEVAATHLRRAVGSSDEQGQLKIISLVADIADRVLLSSTQDKQKLFDGGEDYLKSIYGKIKSWVAENELETPCRWLILDDVSTLASVLGNEVLVYQFVDSIQALANRRQNLGLMMRCSMELDQTLFKSAQIDERHDKTGWLGAGGLSHKEETKRAQQEWIPWERMIEFMDIIVDVVPLSSGYSREAHGRLIFTEYPGGRRWSGSTTASDKPNIPIGPVSAPPILAWSKFVINYCLQESGVRAIRLRESATST